MVAHCRELIGEDTGAILSVADEYFMPLVLRPSAIHRPAHAPCTIPDMDKNDMTVCALENLGDAGQLPIVSALPSSSGCVLNLAKRLRESEVGLDAFLNSVKIWNKPVQVLLSLPSISGAQMALSNFLKRFVDQGALPDANFGVCPAGEEHDFLDAMVEAGLAEHTASQFI